MKAIVIILFTTVALYSCSQPEKETNFTGTYVTHFQNEYTITDDTLIISKINSSDQAYNIERKSGFIKIRNGVRQSREFKTSKWDATYNSDTKALQQTDLGKQLYLTENNNVKLGNSQYTKVK
jgi:hypothetical protein